MTAYRTVKTTAVVEFVDRRSRFIGEVRPLCDEEAAGAFVEEICKAHWDARHHVYAYSLRAGNIRRFSDDGEPQGTAGLPVLDVLQKRALCDCGVVVTRYFGGILLGGGGLVRAYSHTAALAVDAAGVVEMRPALEIEIVCDYAQYGFLPALIADAQGEILDTVYTDTVTLRAVLEADRRSSFSEALTERSAGTLIATVVKQTYRAVDVE